MLLFLKFHIVEMRKNNKYFKTLLLKNSKYQYFKKRIRSQLHLFPSNKIKIKKLVLHVVIIFIVKDGQGGFIEGLKEYEDADKITVLLGHEVKS